MPASELGFGEEILEPPPLPNGAEVLFARGAIERTPEVVARTGARRLLLVRGRRSFEASGAARMLPELQGVAEVVEWSDFSPNTDAADVLRGLRVADQAAPDAIVAVGGGSTLDMAKLLASFTGAERDESHLHAAIREGAPVQERRQHLVLAPTTSGSGSEATHFAVVYIGDEKFSVGGPALRPDSVILDPELSMSGSEYQRASSGIDAVCQAIESLWAVGATAESRRFADAALSHLLPSIEVFVTRPDADSAASMAIGSHLAGRAIDISKTTAAHALSYAITKRYGVNHGHAVALTLPAFVVEHADVTSEALREGIELETHTAALDRIVEHLGAPTAHEASEHFQHLMERIGLENGLRAVGAGSASEADRIASAVNPDRLRNNPVRMDQDDLKRILRDVA